MWCLIRRLVLCGKAKQGYEKSITETCTDFSTTDESSEIADLSVFDIKFEIKNVGKKSTCTIWDSLKLLAFFLFWLGFITGIFFAILFIGE